MRDNTASDQRKRWRRTVEARKGRRMRPTLMALEDRSLLSIIVNNPTDTPVGGETDLRQAIVQANAATSPSSIEIELGTSPATITLSQGQLELSNTSNATTIYDGPGEGPVTISGNNANIQLTITSPLTESVTLG